MKRSFRISTHRSVSYIVTIYLIIIALVILWAGQLLGTITRNDPGRTPALMALSIMFPAALLALAAVNLVRILGQKKAGAPGGRLRLRFVGSFTAIVLVTAAPLSVLFALFLRTAISLWLAPSTGMALESGHRITAIYYEESLERLGDLAESPTLWEVLADPAVDVGTLQAFTAEFAPYVDAVQLDGPDGMLELGDPELFADLDAFTDRRRGVLPRKILDRGTVVSWRKNKDGRTLILSTLLHREFESNIGLIAAALDDWERYSRLRGAIGASLALFSFFLSVPLLLMSLLIGMALADRIIRPLAALGEATGKISEGDFSFRVLSPGKDDELDFLTESFNLMIRELETSRTKTAQTEKVAAWQLIAQRLAHELRNPLTPIKLSAQRIQRKATEGRLDSETASATMDLILEKVQGLDKLLQDFREFAGGGPPETQNITLRGLLGEEIGRFGTIDAPMECSLLPGEDDPPVEADPLQIRQVLVSLLKNAREAGAEKVAARLDVVRRGSSPYVRIQIRDNGEGIAKERTAKVFQPYHSTRDRGSGFGLAVVQRIIHDHHGQIWFESSQGTGTVFYVDIPTKEAE